MGACKSSCPVMATMMIMVGGIWCKIWAAARALASMHNLQLGGQLSIVVPVAMSIAHDPLVGHARAVGGLQRLQKTISSLAPLAAKGVSSVDFIVTGPCSDLGAPTVAALGAAFGASPTRLSVLFGPDSDLKELMQRCERAAVDASFFAALASQQHLPHLSNLELKRTSWKDERPQKQLLHCCWLRAASPPSHCTSWFHVLPATWQSWRGCRPCCRPCPRPCH